MDNLPLSHRAYWTVQDARYYSPGEIDDDPDILEVLQLAHKEPASMYWTFFSDDQDRRIPKMLLYGELNRRDNGRVLKWHKDTAKANMNNWIVLLRLLQVILKINYNRWESPIL